MRLKKRPWGEVILEKHKELIVNQEEIKDSELFNQFISWDHLVLEIGSGKGDFVIQMAKKYPNIHFIAIEMQSMALAYAIKKMENETLDNVLFVNADAHYLFEVLNQHRFETIFLNFSDPWPKKRHHKRRLTYPSMLKEYYNILKDEGKLIFKSDNDLLFADSVEYLKDSDFVVISIDYNYDGSDEYDAQTEYEMKFRSLNTPIKRYVAQKKEQK
jgi:tRNA (guanine-N7-)-methyltransferase